MAKLHIIFYNDNDYMHKNIALQPSILILYMIFTDKISYISYIGIYDKL